MVIGCVAFPFGWNSDDFRKVCGPESNRFEPGLCGIRWAYPLAIIGCIDGVILATLAFILATRHVRLQPEPVYQGSMYKGKKRRNGMTRRSVIIMRIFPDVASIAGSRKSMNLQPVLLVSPHHAHHAHHNMMGSAGSGHLGPMHHGGDDTISQFSSRTAANNRYNRPEYHNSSMHQFQL